MRERPLSDEPELAITDEFEPDNNEPWFEDDDDQPRDDADTWLDPDAELVDEVGPGQVTAGDDPDIAVQSDVADNQLTDPLGDQSVGDAPPEVAPTEQQSEAASDQQPEAQQPPQIDPIEQLLAGDDAELEAAIRQAQAEADAAAQALESWSQRQDDLQQTLEKAKERIAALRPKRAELLAEVLLRGNKRAKGELDRLTRDLRELQDIVDDYQQVLLVAAAEGAKLYAEVAHHSAVVRQLQAKLAARRLVRQGLQVDQAIRGFLDALAAMRQGLDELIPLLDEPSRRYLDQFRTDLPVRLALHHHARAAGMTGVLDLPPFEPRSARPLAVQLADLLYSLQAGHGEGNKEVANAELQRTDASGTAAAAQ
jgi:predicted  nucleic acid-binding Zn-ribbon protein